MKRNIAFSEELKKLQKMKEEMARAWNNLFVRTPNRTEEEIWQWCERLPKFEGVGRNSSNHRVNKTVK